MRRIAVVLIGLLGLIAAATPMAARGAELPAKVAIIVGPVGAELTPVYISLADAAADAAEQRGATVARAYSPHATAERVLEAVAGAHVVVYFGHGVGTPNPYSLDPSPQTMNGWGLNGPTPDGTDADTASDGSLVYYGEAWLAANARPAPGFVMIYSNACYAPGAGEGHDLPASEEVAAARVSAYSRAPLAELGAGAYFATDFHQGAAHLVAALLDRPDAPFGEIFAASPDYVGDGVVRLDHGALAGAETWLQRSPYFEGKTDYWYAFAGVASATFSGGLGGEGLLLGAPRPGGRIGSGLSLGAVDGRITGIASSYPENIGWEGLPTVALPLQLGGGIPTGAPTVVLVCADRCVTLPVVDSCPCYVGTPDQRIVNLSHAAWAAVTDLPLSEGLIEVTLHLSPVADRAAGGILSGGVPDA